MGHLFALWIAFLHACKGLANPARVLAPTLSGVSNGAVIAWVIRDSVDTTVPNYVSIGVLMMVIWTWGIFGIGWSLNREFWEGTIEFNLASRTPISAVMFAKAVAEVIWCLPSAVLSYITTIVISGTSFEPRTFLLTLPSVVVTLFGLLSVEFVFAPLTVLVRGRSGFFNALMPFGVALSGFYFPVSMLPTGIRTASWLLPTSWGMKSVSLSISNAGAALPVWGNLVVSLGLSVVYLFLTVLLFRAVEKRILITGTLVTS